MSEKTKVWITKFIAFIVVMACLVVGREIWGIDYLITFGFAFIITHISLKELGKD